MPWVKKAAAPDYLNALARLRVALTGSVDDWLLPWINLVDWGAALDVNAFCAAGPPEPANFTVDDFLPALVGGLPGAGVAIFGLREKVNRRAAEVLFGDLCEESLATGSTCDVLYADATTATLPFVGGWSDVPAGTTFVRVTLTTDYTGGTHDLHLYWGTLAHTNIGESTPAGGGTWGTVGTYKDFPVVGAGRSFYCWTNGSGAHWRFDTCHAGSIAPFVPPAITQPDSAIPPEPGVYTTISDLGAELDNIEQKLHWILNFTTEQMTDRINPLVADDVIVIEEEDEDVPLGPNVMGFIVTLTSIPGSADERFGEPIQLHNLGRVVMGNGDAWLPPINLSVTPMLILKPDPTVTVARVHTYPPTGATIHTLIRPPAVG